MKRQQKRRSKPVIVDIVLPVYGEPDFLRACLESLFAHDAGVHYTVTLVDDLSPDQEELAGVYGWALSKSPNVRVIKHRQNLGFAATCNGGAKRGKAPFILLLNTDTLIMYDDWLARMVEECRQPKVAVVGCLLTFFSDSSHPNRPAGKTQHAGVAFDIIGRPYHIFSGWHPGHPKVQTRREMSAVTGACLLTKRKVWKRLGGLDTDYTRGNFEDVQYCVQARMAGFKVVYTPNVQLAHFAGGSNNSMTAKRNAQIFQLKMGKHVEYDEWRYW